MGSMGQGLCPRVPEQRSVERADPWALSGVWAKVPDIWVPWPSFKLGLVVQGTMGPDSGSQKSQSIGAGLRGGCCKISGI